MPAIVYSTADPAGKSIAKALLASREFSFSERHADYKMWASDYNDAVLVEIDHPLISAEDLLIETDYLIFASRHRSASGKPCFTVHPTGNWSGDAPLGGNANELSYVQASAMKHAFLALSKLSAGNEIFQPTMEATHHGPTSLHHELFFIELGSGEKEWADMKAASIVAEAIMRAIDAEREKEFAIRAFGIGGTHYCSDFNKIELKSNIAMGHVLTGDRFDSAGDEMLQQAVEKGEAELIILDWKGLKAAQRERAIKFAEGAGIKWKKDDEVK